MRFVRPHIAFQLLFCLSIFTLLAGVFLALTSSDACVSNSNDPKCGLDAAGRQHGGVAVAIGGLALMIGGVGFQIGRSAPAAAAPPQGAFPPGPPPGFQPQYGPPAGGAPQPQSAPPQQQGQRQDPGQWGQSQA